MTTDEYENNVLARASKQNPKVVEPNLVHGAMGLNEEAGEVLAIVRKATFYGKPIDLMDVKLELGDALWFLTLAAKSIGSSLNELMTLNEAKLAARFEGTKFDPHKAINKNELGKAQQMPLFNDLRDDPTLRLN